MKKAAVIYWSGTGNTEAMANAVLEGMKSAGADAVLLTASDVDGSAEKNIYADKQSGKDFNRPQYKKLLRKMKKRRSALHQEHRPSRA